MAQETFQQKWLVLSQLLGFGHQPLQPRRPGTICPLITKLPAHTKELLSPNC